MVESVGKQSCYFFEFTQITPQIAPLIVPNKMSIKSVQSKLKPPFKIEKTTKAKML